MDEEVVLLEEQVAALQADVESLQSRLADAEALAAGRDAELSRARQRLAEREAEASAFSAEAESLRSATAGAEERGRLAAGRYRELLLAREPDLPEDMVAAPRSRRSTPPPSVPARPSPRCASASRPRPRRRASPPAPLPAAPLTPPASAPRRRSVSGCDRHSRDFFANPKMPNADSENAREIEKIGTLTGSGVCPGFHCRSRPMALTLTEAAKLSNDVVQQGVIETVVKESRVPRRPAVHRDGRQRADLQPRERDGLRRVLRRGRHLVGESTPTFSQVAATLKILGGDADVDQYIATTRSNVQDIEAAVLELKAKAVAHEFEDDVRLRRHRGRRQGLRRPAQARAAGQQVHQGSGTTPAALSLKKLDEAIDLIRPGKPDLLLMTRRTRRGLSAFARALTSPVHLRGGRVRQPR